MFSSLLTLPNFFFWGGGVVSVCFPAEIVACHGFLIEEIFYGPALRTGTARYQNHRTVESGMGRIRRENEKGWRGRVVDLGSGGVEVQAATELKSRWRRR
jgi:hypothetical protein